MGGLNAGALTARMHRLFHTTVKDGHTISITILENVIDSRVVYDNQLKHHKLSMCSNRVKNKQDQDAMQNQSGTQI